MQLNKKDKQHVQMLDKALRFARDPDIAGHYGHNDC